MSEPLYRRKKVVVARVLMPNKGFEFPLDKNGKLTKGDENWQAYQSIVKAVGVFHPDCFVDRFARGEYSEFYRYEFEAVTDDESC